MPHEPNALPKLSSEEQSVGNLSTVETSGTNHKDAQTTLSGSSRTAPLLDAPVISGYRILGELARGGMGRVLAAREELLDREVAIKVLLPRADARRFITEAKLTAQLPHPSIPPVYALGHLADGSPFLAMKLVRGKTLAEELKGRPEPLSELPRFLQIFEQIAQAVGFAHSQGIIHRDLKPANVMVGAFGEVQVMDWGLAKELKDKENTNAVPDQGHDSGERESHGYHIGREESTPNAQGDETRSGTILGTPNYMAPEQARGEEVDARADVFSLGGILCAILTGHAVFGGKSVLETLQQAASGDTTAALARLEISGAEAEVIALARQCLAVHPADRPADGQAVAAMVAKYRHGVEERLQQSQAEEAASRARAIEQTKRRRTVQWSAGLLMLALVAGISGTSVGYLRAEQKAEDERLAKEIANEEKSKAIAARKQALANLQYAKKGNEILGSIFLGLNPEKIAESGRPLQEVLKDNLKRAVRALDGSALGDPLTMSEMQNMLGVSLTSLGEYDQASVVLAKAYATNMAELGPAHQETLSCLNNLALSYHEGGQLVKAFALFEKALEATQAKFGPEHSDTLTVMHNIANLYDTLGDNKQALLLNEKILRIRIEKLGADHPDTLESLNNLAISYETTGQREKARALLEETLQRRKATLGLNHPHTLLSMNNLGKHYLDDNLLDKALSLFEEALKRQKATVGVEHPDTLTFMNNLAVTYRALQQMEKAEMMLEETLKLRRAHLGVDHPDTLNSMNSLAAGYFSTGKFDQAIALFREALKLMEKKLGRRHPDTLRIMANLGMAYIRVGLLAEAEAVLAESYQGAAKHPDLRWVGNALLDCYARSNKRQETITLSEKLLAEARANFPQVSPQMTSALAQLSNSLYQVRAYAEAEPLLRECLQNREKHEPNLWTTFNTMSLLGGVLTGQKKYAEAEALLVKGYEGMKKRQAMIPVQGSFRLTEAVTRLIQFYTETGKVDEVKKWKAEKGKLKTDDTKKP